MLLCHFHNFKKKNMLGFVYLRPKGNIYLNKVKEDSKIYCPQNFIFYTMVPNIHGILYILFLILGTYVCFRYNVVSSTALFLFSLYFIIPKSNVF